jgi:hypothetical protein
VQQTYQNEATEGKIRPLSDHLMLRKKGKNSGKVAVFSFNLN